MMDEKLTKKLFCRAEKGASMVEFAIILPLLILILFGIIEFGILLYDKAVITNASREGARLGIVFKEPRFSAAAIEDVVKNYCNNYLITLGTKTLPVTTINPADPTTMASGTPLTVTVTYQYHFLVIPNFATDLIDGVELVADTTMRAE